MTDPRVVAITGGSAGVGRATALAFARRGDRVAVIARGKHALINTVDEMTQWGATAHAVVADVSDPDAVEAAAEQIEHELGPIDIWINNAMVTVFGPVAKLEPEELARVTDVNYHGLVWGTMAALRRMRDRNRGTIIQVGSALSYRPIPLQAPYCASKHAARAFTDSVRCELIHDRSRVRITSVHLPALNTPQFSWGRSHMDVQPQPVPPIYSPDVAARAITYAADHDRREVYVGWSTIKAVFGNKVAPNALDYYLAHAAWNGQLTDVERPPGPGNLFSPVSGDFGAHGMFTARESQASWLDRTALRLSAASILALLVAVPLLSAAAALAAALAIFD